MTPSPEDLNRCGYCDKEHERSEWEDGTRYCSDACTPSGRLAVAEREVERLRAEVERVGNLWSEALEVGYDLLAQRDARGKEMLRVAEALGRVHEPSMGPRYAADVDTLVARATALTAAETERDRLRAEAERKPNGAEAVASWKHLGAEPEDLGYALACLATAPEGVQCHVDAVVIAMKDAREERNRLRAESEARLAAVVQLQDERDTLAQQLRETNASFAATQNALDDLRAWEARAREAMALAHAHSAATDGTLVTATLRAVLAERV